MCVAVRKYGCPPDKQENATLTVLEQAEVLRRGIGQCRVAVLIFEVRHGS